MPLFMDLHDASDYDVKPTVEEIKRNHIADLAVQEKHGVKFIQYWINEDVGMVFCLMEAPSKEACAAVHQEAHGAMPCRIIELKGGDYSAFIENTGRVNEYDIVEDSSGRPDKAYRIIVTIDIIGKSSQKIADEILQQHARECDGRIISFTHVRKSLSFLSVKAGFEFMLKFKKVFADKNDFEWCAGIAAGPPVTNEYELYGEAISMSETLNEIAGTNEVYINSLALSLGETLPYKTILSVKSINKKDENFTRMVYEKLRKQIFEQDFSLDRFCLSIGMSRSSLYRRLVAITGRTPNDIIQELRLRKAYTLLLGGEGNVTQVAYETGYNNPAYFSKRFSERFQLSPNKLKC